MTTLSSLRRVSNERSGRRPRATTLVALGTAVLLGLSAVPHSAQLASAAVTSPAVNLSWLDYYFDNKGIGSDATGDGPNFDAAGKGLHRSNLISGGLVFSGDMTSPKDSSLTFRMGGSLVGASPDNIVAAGQTINTKVALGSDAVKPATKIALVVASRNAGDVSGSPTYTLGFSDGTSESLAMPNVDWCTSSPPSGVTAVATRMPRYGDNVACTIYISDSVSLGGKMVDSVTLPDESRIHLFAIASDADTGNADAPTGAVVLPESVAVGQLMSAPRPDWVGATPDRVEGYWLLDGVRQSAQSSAAFRVPASWAGHELAYAVIGHRAGYRAAGLQTDEVAVSAGGLQVVQAPTITGLARVGDTLVLNTGSYATNWESPTDSAISRISWSADGVAIDGVDDTMLIPDSQTVGKRITATLTVSKKGYGDIDVTTDPTAAVLAQGVSPYPGPTSPAGPAPLVAIRTPSTGSGTVAVGGTLTVTAGTYATAGTRVSYEWLRGTSVIPRANSASYLLVAADNGAVITARVTAAAAGYQPAVQVIGFDKVSAGTLRVGTPTLRVGAKVVTARTKLKVGSTLTVQPAPASAPGSQLSIGYQWYAAGKQLPGSSGRATSLRLTGKLVKKRIQLRLTYTASGYRTATVVSVQTAKVAR
jgi:hypothetical protein